MYVSSIFKHLEFLTDTLRKGSAGGEAQDHAVHPLGLIYIRGLAVAYLLYL